MNDFLSNSWVVSIVSGILVFIFTNLFINVKNRSQSKKQINDANVNVLNYIRGYVVDNGLPNQKIIEAVKKSVAREYNIKYVDLLSIRELCEELVKDIIGNIYISNESRKKYITMLEDYLEQNKNIDDKNNENNIEKYGGKTYEYLSIVISLIAGTITAIGSSLPTYFDSKMAWDKIGIIVIIPAILFIGIGFILYFINKKNKK